MATRSLPLVFAALSSLASADTAFLEDAVRGALARDPTFLVQRLDAQKTLLEAEQTDRALMARLSVRPAGARYSISEFGEKREATVAATLIAPGAAGRSVTLDLRESFSLTSNRSVEAMYSHDPQLSVTLRQPLAGAALPGDALARAVRARPQAQRARALASLAAARNGAVLRAARLYYSAAEQRHRIALAETRLAERRAEADNLERLSVLRRGGERDVQRERLSIREEELALSADRRALARLEGELSALLGRSPAVLSLNIPRIEPPAAEPELRKRALEASAAIRRREAELRERQAEAALATLAEAPALSAAVTIDGDYETTDTVPRTLEESHSRLRAKLTVSLLVDLPIARRRDRELAVEAASARAQQAAIERAREESLVLADLAELLAERSRRLELAELRARQAALASEELRVRAGLLDAQQASPAELAAARHAREERDLASWRSRVDLFLLDIELAALLGDDLGRLLIRSPDQAAEGGP